MELWEKKYFVITKNLLKNIKKLKKIRVILGRTKKIFESDITRSWYSKNV